MVYFLKTGDLRISSYKKIYDLVFKIFQLILKVFWGGEDVDESNICSKIWLCSKDKPDKFVDIWTDCDGDFVRAMSNTYGLRWRLSGKWIEVPSALIV